MQSNNQIDIVSKIVIIGDSGVGKTNILLRYLRNLHDPNTKATIGVDFFAKDLFINNQKIKAQIFDTAGQEKYRSICSTYYKNIDGAVVVYDVSNRDSFNNLDYWIGEIVAHNKKNIKMLLIGNKNDLEDEREVNEEEGKEYADVNGMFFMETSALVDNDFRIQKSFEILLDDVIKEIGKINEEDNKTEYDKLVQRSLRYNPSVKKLSMMEIARDEKKCWC